jgi:hypothetical protein
MAFQHGKDSSFKIDNSAGTLTDISSYADSFSSSVDIANHETTPFQAAGGRRTSVPGLIGETLSVSGKYDATVDGILHGILGKTGSFEFIIGAATVGTENPKFSGECCITGYSKDIGVDDVGTWSADFTITGNVTRATS